MEERKINHTSYFLKEKKKRKKERAGNIMNLEVSKLIPWKNQKQYIFTAATANCLYSCDNKEDSEFCVFLKHFIYQITISNSEVKCLVNFINGFVVTLK